MKKLACLLAAVFLLSAMPLPSQAQHFPGLKRIYPTLPNGACPAGTHVVIVNTPGGAQRGCQEN